MPGPRGHTRSCTAGTGRGCEAPAAGFRAPGGQFEGPLRCSADPSFAAVGQRPEGGQEPVELRRERLGRPRAALTSCRSAGRNSTRYGFAIVESLSSSLSATIERFSNVGSASNASAKRLARLRRPRGMCARRCDELFELVVAAGQRVEHDACVAHQARDRAFLGVEHAQRACWCVRRTARGSRTRELICSPRPLMPAAHRLLPDLECRARLRVERGEDVVECHGRQHVAVRRVGRRPARYGPLRPCGISCT